MLNLNRQEIKQSECWIIQKSKAIDILIGCFAIGLIFGIWIGH